MTLTIRPLEKSDYQRWLELWQGYLRFYEAELSSDVTQNTWETLLTPGIGHEGLVAVDETGELVGLAHYLFHRSTWTTGDYCYLEDLFVDADVRRDGAGRALVDAVERVARDKGCTRFYLTTAKTNWPARGLYDQILGSAGFVRYAKTLI